MRHTDTLRERVETMASDELAGVLTFEPGRYQVEFLDLARQELVQRGFTFGGGVIRTPDGLTLKPKYVAPPPPAPAGPVGVGGWLLLYILGHLVCRPVSALGGDVGPSAAYIAELAEMFPATSMILEVDRMVSLGLVIIGFILTGALLKRDSPSAVRATKIYLTVYPLACMFLAALYGFNDFEEGYRESFAQGAMTRAVTASVWSLIWLLYFNRSKRVKATYFAGGQAPAGGAGMVPQRTV